MHRAGFHTIAACEVIPWRRALYSQNNPGVHVYDDVTTLTADRLVRDGIGLPDIIVGSPPCQDIGSANTKGKGVDGERSGLYFEAVRLIDECQPRWFALENSANLRTRGADRVIDALEAIGYTCWPFVVSAGDIGANHERKRSWLTGFKVSDANDQGKLRGGFHAEVGFVQTVECDDRNADKEVSTAVRGLCERQVADDRRGITSDTHGDAVRLAELPERSKPQAPITGNAAEAADDANAGEAERRSDAVQGSNRDGQACERTEGTDRYAEPAALCTRNPPHPDEAGQAAGLLESSLRSAQKPDYGCCDGWSDNGPCVGQMGGSASPSPTPAEPWADWNGGLARHLRLDDGLSTWVAGTRIALGSRKGTAAASLIVEAFGDAVVPQIPEAIGRAILRVEAALALIANDNKQEASIAA
jgi:DNA (cytosine-5)-methyltransferase 1